MIVIHNIFPSWFKHRNDFSNFKLMGNNSSSKRVLKIWHNGTDKFLQNPRGKPSDIKSFFRWKLASSLDYFFRSNRWIAETKQGDVFIKIFIGWAILWINFIDNGRRNGCKKIIEAVCNKLWLRYCKENTANTKDLSYFLFIAIFIRSHDFFRLLWLTRSSFSRYNFFAAQSTLLYRFMNFLKTSREIFNG